MISKEGQRHIGGGHDLAFTKIKEKK